VVSTRGHQRAWRVWASALLLGGLAGAAAAWPSTDAAGAGTVPSGQIPVTGEIEVHDPTLYRDGDTYIVAATHNSIRSAPSLSGPWTDLGDVPKADWTFAISPGTLWAPHVERVDDTFYYYYSQSSFGSQTSAIGLKTTQTPTVPSSYVDHGEPIIASGAASGSDDPYEHNAIDPHVQHDLDGNWWIAWGSHWDGIMIQRLAADMVTPTGEMTQIASRGSARFPIQPGFPVPPNRVEGPAIFQRGGYYYLLTGWDWCCRGDDSTYKISIGRSESIDGPYVDKNGVPLTDGGGSTILDSRFARPGVTPGGLWRAPGGPDVFVEDGTYYLVYHAYLPDNTLGIRPMNWHDGWPYFQEPGGGPYDLSDGAYYRLVNELGPADPESVQNPVASDRCLTAVDDGGEPNVIQRTCDDVSLEQIWRLERQADGFYRFRSMSGNRGRCLEMADGSGEPGTDVVIAPCVVGTGLQQWYLDDTGHGFHRPVVKGANLALEVENVDGTVGTNVIGGFRRDGENRATHPQTGASCASGPAVCADANAWPPQQWRLVMTDPPVGEARLHVEGRPTERLVGPRRKRVTYRLRVDNVGAAPADAVRLCASAPDRRVAIRGKPCVAGGPIPVGGTSRRAVDLRIKPAARGKLTRIRLLAHASNAETERTVVRLRVRG
jgi:Glycosyl hydrolases family 43/Ricin-type beta-trefoil lectin domain